MMLGFSVKYHQQPFLELLCPDLCVKLLVSCDCESRFSDSMVFGRSKPSNQSTETLLLTDSCYIHLVQGTRNARVRLGSSLLNYIVVGKMGTCAHDKYEVVTVF
jgi:hypothetical protein